MGMFDYVDVKMKLPMPVPIQGYKGSNNFQTKDLDNCLWNYIIKKNGTLWVEKVELKITPLTEEEKKKNKFAIHKSEVTKRWTERVHDVNGKVSIYDWQENNGENEPFDYYIEYDIMFKEGKVQSIAVVKFEPTRNFSRKERDKEWQENLVKERELKTKWYYKWLMKPWNIFIDVTFDFVLKRFNNISIFKLRNKLSF